MDRSVKSGANNERTALLQTNSLLPAMSNPLGRSVQLQSSTSEVAPLRPINSQHSIWNTPTTRSIIQSTKKSVSHASEQEDRDSDPNTTTGRPPVSQLDPLTSESLPGDRFTTITTSRSFNGDRAHGPPSDLAESYCHSNFATKSHAGAPKTLSILPNPTLACGHSSVDSGCTSSPESLDDSDLDGQPATSSNLSTDMKLEPLDRHPTITSVLVAETFPTSGREMLESAPVQPDATRGETSPRTLSAPRTDSPLWEHSTIPMLNLPEVAVASPSSQPNLVLMTWTSSELGSNLVSPIRIQLHHTGEQLMGVVQTQENSVSLAPPSHSNGREEDSDNHLGSSVPSSSSRAMLGLQGSVSSWISPPVSTKADESSLAIVTMSAARSASYSLTSSAITGGSSGIRTFVEPSRTMSIHGEPVFDHLQRGYTIPKQSLRMSVGAAVGGTAMFIMIFILHRCVYQWARRRRTGVIQIGHETGSSRDVYIELHPHQTRNPEVSHFWDDS
jgi:hypothetical protein